MTTHMTPTSESGWADGFDDAVRTRNTGFTDPVDVAELREQTRLLAASLPGVLRRISLRLGAAAVEVEWQAAATEPTAPAGRAAAWPAENAEADAEPEADENLTTLHAPMVGTFYRASLPDAEPFVSVGDRVEAGQRIGIVEAMKLFNPIVSEHAGVVAEILAADGSPVEFDQPLMTLRPDDQGGD